VIRLCLCCLSKSMINAAEFCASSACQWKASNFKGNTVNKAHWIWKIEDAYKQDSRPKNSAVILQQKHLLNEAKELIFLDLS
jgi:hypothetical protein